MFTTLLQNSGNTKAVPNYFFMLIFSEDYTFQQLMREKMIETPLKGSAHNDPYDFRGVHARTKTLRHGLMEFLPSPLTAWSKTCSGILTETLRAAMIIESTLRVYAIQASCTSSSCIMKNWF